VSDLVLNCMRSFACHAGTSRRHILGPWVPCDLRCEVSHCSAGYCVKRRRHNACLHCRGLVACPRWSCCIVRAALAAQQSLASPLYPRARTSSVVGLPLVMTTRVGEALRHMQRAGEDCNMVHAACMFALLAQRCAWVCMFGHAPNHCLVQPLYARATCTSCTCRSVG
jgi:hypothetical protein